MIGLTTAPTTSTAQVPNSSIQNTSIVGLFSNNQRRTICPCPCSFTSCSVKYSYSLRSICNPIKAIAAQETAAETQFVPKPNSQSSSYGNKKQALISLSDKRDLTLLGNGLQNLGYTIVSTGGTASSLESDGVSATKVEELTSLPKMLDGSVKTLHPNAHGGILARRDQKRKLLMNMELVRTRIQNVLDNFQNGMQS